ncbi:hypothetical protein DM47_3304 [Burkholderia mallei]|nr:hypothetical protein DM46_2609 [Burkholderia mallei]KOS94607.1 hypothetical protein DM45_3808 [Burkholderia mallei]KOT18828.1 hypothetical protein DM47_3304 [Burkholderia mallei]
MGSFEHQALILSAFFLPRIAVQHPRCGRPTRLTPLLASID